MVDVVTGLAGEDGLGRLLYADDLVLISDAIYGLRNKFRKWMEAFESKSLRITFWTSNG